jgi:hypothetical protein
MRSGCPHQDSSPLLPGPFALDLARNAAAYAGAILVPRSEVHAQQHARFNHLVHEIAGATEVPLFSCSDVPRRNGDAALEEVFDGVSNRR